MSLVRPNARVSIDGQELSAAEAALSRVDVQLGLDGSHDAASLVCWSSSKFKDAAAGAPIEVSLGPSGDEVLVFTGEVTCAERALDGVYIEALAPTAKLSRSYRSQTYLDQSVADIVRDLASEASIDAVEGDITFSAYYVDGRCSVWSNVKQLAALVGADVGASEKGELRFVLPKVGSAETSFRYGAELLAFAGGPVAARQAAQPVPLGAGSEAGAEQWHWLLGGDSEAEDGAVRPLGSLRTRDAADRVSEAWSKRYERAAYRARLRILGHAGLRPGDLIGVSDLPGDSGGLLGAATAAVGGLLGGGAPEPPAALRLLCVVHSLDAQQGFVSDLVAEGVGS